MSALDQFLEHYQRIRRAEGWGGSEDAYYRNLPQVAATDPQRAIWRVRAASFRALLQILGRHRRVLDAGAGNGWLAFQLAQRGHVVVAIDVNHDERDGLGALGNYPIAPRAYRADFSALPFGEARFDAVVFAASLHYAHDLTLVVAEALRVLARDGIIVVMDSPLFGDASGGRAMLAEKQRDLQERFDLDIAPGPIGFLTSADFDRMAQAFSLSWRWVEPYVDVRWNTRHLRARLRGQRMPARFGLMIGQRKGNGFVSFDARGERGDQIQ